MGTGPSGRLRRLDLRKCWGNEAADFTPWLAGEENIALLSEAIGLQLQVHEQEAAVGPFRADILCKAPMQRGDHWVLVENQLEVTDHKHLGQLLTYAAGLDAVSIVWIAERFTEEHRAAIDWLNRVTAEGINFFGLEIELWQIGDSEPAPKFNVVCEPNEWSTTVRDSAQNEVPSELKQLKLAFWTGFRDFLGADFPLRLVKPTPSRNFGVNIGKYWVGASIVKWDAISRTNDSVIEVGIGPWGNQAPSNYNALLARRAEIEAKLGYGLTWHDESGVPKNFVFVLQRADFSDRAKWPTQFKWLKDRLLDLHRVVVPLLA